MDRCYIATLLLLIVATLVRRRVWSWEAEDEIQIVVHGHYSMGLATPDKQVGHTHGLHVTAAVGPKDVDMEQK